MVVAQLASKAAEYLATRLPAWLRPLQSTTSIFLVNRLQVWSVTNSDGKWSIAERVVFVDLTQDQLTM